MPPDRNTLTVDNMSRRSQMQNHPLVADATAVLTRQSAFIVHSLTDAVAVFLQSTAMG